MPTRRAFTLAELMVAVAILAVVILATASIFGTASTVTGMSEAATDVLQEAAAIERQIRSDFERLSKDGFFAIRCTAIRNDYNVNVPGGGLLDPLLPPDAWVRADQLVFFTQGVQSVQTIRQGSSQKGQSTAARVYYGHAVQFPEAPAVQAPQGQPYVLAIDQDIPLTNPVFPWTMGTRPFVRTRFYNLSDPAQFQVDSPYPNNPVNVTQPPAKNWVLARHSLALADDAGEPTIFLGWNSAAELIADPVVVNGRVDAAAQQLNQIKRFLELPGTAYEEWLHQRPKIASQMFYPRAERVAPGPHRVDQALTNHVLAGACSSFTIDWTYSDGTGDATSNLGDYRGAWIDGSIEKPWFGLDALGQAGESRGVRTFREWATDIATDPPQTIFWGNIEGQFSGAPAPGIQNYSAYFGYNRDAPFHGPIGPDPAIGAPHIKVGFTPWPTAIRITMRLHDVAGRLEAGRVVQYVVDLPRREG